ncbi:MAG: cephalosporin hydroxylase family protein [Thermomicrobiales bacterium]
MKITINTDTKQVAYEEEGGTHAFDLYSKEAFDLLTGPWLDAGWGLGYAYTFTWMGRPMIQLPEDMIRTQEVIYRVKPDLIIETGIAHGGSLIYYASLCKAMEHGRVVGVDIEIRPHNRQAIEAHELFPYITLIEGSSTAPEIVAQVRSLVPPGTSALVILDSNHTKQHVLDELHVYADLVTPGSYIVVTDGIMKDLVGAPGAGPDWAENNPFAAARAFLAGHPEFVLEQPPWPFNESRGLRDNVTYWPGAWLRRT